MSLNDVSLPKRYRNSQVLYEANLDDWRQATETAFATVNLNLTQLRKDLFLTGYDYDNDGNANLGTSLQQQINAITSGGTPITGTTSDTFTINSDGFSATLTTASLTATRTFTFPDLTGIIAVREAAVLTLPELSTADPTLIFSIASGAAYHIGLDNSASDQFYIGRGTVVGTTPLIRGEAGGSSNDNFWEVRNDFNTASSRAYLQITTGGATASDPLLILNIDGVTQYHIGLDNSASDQFYIGRGTVVGTTPLIRGEAGGSSNDNFWEVRNDFNTASSRAYFNVTVGGTTASDPFYLLTIPGGSTYHIGLDNSASDQFFIGLGSVIGTTPLIRGEAGGSSNDNFWEVRNDFDVASSRAYFNAMVGGTSAGDPFYLLTVTGGSAYHIGLDNSDSDLLKIGTGTAVGTNTIATFSSGGVLLPDTDPPSANEINRNSGLKAKLTYVDASGVVTDSYNIDSVGDDDGGGDFDVVVDTDFAGGDDTSYTIVGSAYGATDAGFSDYGPKDVGTARILTYTASTGISTDYGFSLAMFGKQ